MKLSVAGRLDLDAPLENLLPGYYPTDKRSLTVRLLMCHAAGLPSGLRLRGDLPPDAGGTAPRRSVIERFLEAPIVAEPGRQTLYSDIGPILVGDLLERLTLTGLARLDAICADELYAPLGLRDTFYIHLDLHPSRRPVARCTASTGNLRCHRGLLMARPGAVW